jgi:hypothetical protein
VDDVRFWTCRAKLAAGEFPQVIGDLRRAVPFGWVPKNPPV